MSALVTIGLISLGALLLSKKKNVACPQGDTGAEFEGVIYKEIVTGGAKHSDALPMFIVFHGKDATPDHLIPILSTINKKARFIIPQGILDENGNYAWWKLGAKDEDQDALAQRMTFAANYLESFIENIPKCRKTIGRPIVAGHSQGGMLSYAIATLFPHLVAAAIPASGWLPRPLWDPKTAPIYAVHGSGDDIVPYKWDLEYIAQMRAEGANQIFWKTVSGGHPLSGILRATWLDIMKFTIINGVHSWENFGKLFK